MPDLPLKDQNLTQTNHAEYTWLLREIRDLVRRYEEFKALQPREAWEQSADGTETIRAKPKEGEKSFENECYAWDRPVIGRKLDKALAENARLRAALEEMIEISQRNSDATLMLIAIRKCAQHALQPKEGEKC